MLIRATAITFFKNSIWKSVNAEFHAVVNVLKNVQKKDVTKKCTFLFLLVFIKLVLLITFFVHFCKTFFTDLKSA
jgi:uncharacterized membrane protein (DUF485 family)